MPSDEIQVSRARINSALRQSVRRKVRVRTAESHDRRAVRARLTTVFCAGCCLIAHAIMRIAIRPAGLRQSPAIVEIRFRRVPEGPSAIVAGQGQSRDQFSALSTRRLDDRFRTERRRNQIGRASRIVRIGRYMGLMENEGAFRRFDLLGHSDFLFLSASGTSPGSFSADLGRIAFTRRKKRADRNPPFSVVVYLPLLFGARNERGCKIVAQIDHCSAVLGLADTRPGSDQRFRKTLADRGDICATHAEAHHFGLHRLRRAVRKGLGYKTWIPPGRVGPGRGFVTIQGVFGGLHGQRDDRSR